MKSCRKNGKSLPEGYGTLKLPAEPLFKPYQANENWALRMAARSLMEFDNGLQVRDKTTRFLNPALPKGKRLWKDAPIVERYISLDRKRLTGIYNKDYNALSGKAKKAARKDAATKLMSRIAALVQRRHDIAHNCDRPKTALQKITVPSVKKGLEDIKSFVVMLDDHLDAHRIH